MHIVENNTSWYSEENILKCLTWRLLREKKLFVGRFASIYRKTISTIKMIRGERFCSTDAFIHMQEAV